MQKFLACIFWAAAILCKVGNSDALKESQDDEFWTSFNEHRYSLWPDDYTCKYSIWCAVEMPKKSHFRFEPPTNITRWRQAIMSALKGEQLLLKSSLQHFPNHHDFLDGDQNFRVQHNLGDIFVDKYKDLSQLIGNEVHPTEFYPWEKKYVNSTIPTKFDVATTKKAPIVFLGYYAFSRHKRTGAYFGGEFLGGTQYSIHNFLAQWAAATSTKEFTTPFVLHHGNMNENWGMFSTGFPNRTKDWIFCCPEKMKKKLTKILDNEKLLMFVTNQHSNFSHPKLLTLPRGLPSHYIHGKHQQKRYCRIYIHVYWYIKSEDYVLLNET